MSRQVGFLYFHQIYHIYHSAPIAYELSKMDTDIQVHLFAASENSRKALEELGAHYPDHKAILHVVSPGWGYQFLNIKRRTFPKPKTTLKIAAQELNQMDVLVATSFETSRLFDNYGVTQPRYVFAFHGAGDGEYGFQKELSSYDLLLLSGEKVKTRLDGLGILKQGNHAVIGYPKFDATSKLNKSKEPLFDNDRPVVVYNPHWNTELSSWYNWGETVLDYFTKSDQYNLIFAPHSVIKDRKQRWLSLRRFRRFSNIFIDLGSRSLFDMSYTLAADIYLGDVSSQVYEFLSNPRPCIFLNSQAVDWSDDPNYVHWHLGAVLDDPRDMESALEDAIASPEAYRDQQLVAFDQCMSQTSMPAGQRGAEAIAKWMDR